MDEQKFLTLTASCDLRRYGGETPGGLDGEAVHRELTRDWDEVPPDARDPDFFVEFSIPEVSPDKFRPRTVEVQTGSIRFDFLLREHRAIGRPVLPISYRTASQLGGVCDAGSNPRQYCRFLDASGRATSAILDKKHVADVFNEVVKAIQPGPIAMGLFPPVFLREFRGPRAFGDLDARIADLAYRDIVPKPLLEKARDLDASNAWAVVISEQNAADQDLLNSLEPLVRHRRGQIRTLRAGPSGQTIVQFENELCALSTAERPYYLMVVGDLDDISMESMYLLQSYGGVGRLPFTDPADVSAYVDKVIRLEQRPSDAAPNALFIATDRDDTNTANFESIVRGLHGHAMATGVASTLTAWGTASKNEVLAAARGAGPRTLGVVCGHGFEHLDTAGERTDALLADQREFQGAIIMDDYREPRRLGSTEGLLGPSDVEAAPFLSGGMLVLHACYSAGTIRRDTMPEWVHLPLRNRLVPNREFTSEFALALLRNPNGPSALLAHVNRSYQYDYYHPTREGDSVSQDAYSHLIDTLLSGLPIGYGRERLRVLSYEYMYQLMTVSYQLESKIADISADGSVDSPSRPLTAYEHAFMQYSFATCNFRNYVILGDPMARLWID